MTRMANRFGLQKHGREAFSNAITNNTSFAIEILDIDYFKQYNDNYGHQAGDECIKSVANAILMQKQYGKVFCARYGGDEFIIIYEDFEYSDIDKMAHELKDVVTSFFFQLTMVYQCQYFIEDLNRDFNSIEWKDRGRKNKA